MKYTVRIGGQTFSVEIDDLQRRPVLARIDGKTYAVEPELVLGDWVPAVPPTAAAAAPAAKAAPAVAAAPAPTNGAATMVSPLPGNIVEVFVAVGDAVEAGAAVFVVEAMKMKNTLRAQRAGRIKKIHVATGQTVAHKQALLEFEA